MRKHRRPLFIACVSIAVMATAMASSLFATQQDAPSVNILSIPQRQPVALPSIAAPSGQPETSLEVPSLKLRTQPGFEQVTVTVTDSSGKYVTNLKEDDFRILEDGHQRPVGYFRIDRSAPVSIGIIVDCSTSMMTKFAQARRAITSMVDNLDPRDDIFLESFSVEARLLQPFTVDHQQIIDHLRLLHAVKSTSLYDAVFMGLYEMRLARRDKRALLVITDGLDNTSTTRWEQVIATARAMRVLIYSVGIGEQMVNTRANRWWEVFASDSDEVDMQALRTLSDETGARAFNLRRVGDGEELSRDCAAISNELRQQYTLAYVSPDPMRLSYRSLHVDVPKHPELSVRVRKGVAIIPPATPP
ncbi:MAG TPA: VWA domain-containing protein [Candidatus Binataceae bacterium]|nr:VWA domain-containing protein [Candidatus Binataceae bacterium]